MVALLGMAGLAEAGEAFGLMVGYACVLGLGFAVAISFAIQSRVALGIAYGVAFLLTIIFTPWEAFRSIESSDPDVRDWVNSWRVFGFWWGVGVVALIVATVRVFVFSGKGAVSSPKGEAVSS